MIANPETLYRNINVTNGTAANIKSSSGQLTSYFLSNSGGSACYVKFYDKASATASDTPALTIYVPSAGAANLSGISWTFNSAISIRAVSGFADSDNTAPSAGSIIANLGYR